MYSIQILRDSGAWHYVTGSGYRGDWLREAKLVQSSNSIGSLTLSVLPSYPLLSELTCNRRVRAQDEDTGEYVFYGRVIDATPQMDEDGAVFTEVTCEDALGFLQDTAVWIDSRKGYFEGTNKNYKVEIDDEDGTRTIASADLLSLIIAQHNSTVGDYHGDAWKKVTKGSIDVDAEDETTFEAEYEATTYEMLQDLAEDADWEYRSRYDGSKVYIDVADQLGEAGGEFILGDNMKATALKTTMADVATRVFPYGVEYAKLKKTVRKGTKVTGRVKSDKLDTKNGVMMRFPCEKSIKCVLTVGARKDGYAMVLFTKDKLTSKNVKKAVVKKYTAGTTSSENATKRYPVPEKAKYVYVMGADSACTTYGYHYNDAGAAIGKNYRTDLAYWKKKLTDAKLSKILKKYGVTMGSVVDGSGDRSYFLSKNEDKYGVIEYSPVKTQSLKTDKITNSSKAVYSIDDLKGANKAKATAFVKWACRKLKKKCKESCELTVTGYDLKEAGLNYDALRLYDTWKVTNDLAGFSASAEVVRVERDLLKPWSVEVEMGTKVTRSSASTRGNGLEGDGAADESGDDDDSYEDEYSTLVNQYADAAEEAAAQAIESADELDSLSRRIQVDSLAAGQMASEAYDTVHPITQAMRDALDQAEQQAHELTAVKEANSQTIEVANDLARAVATYSYETEKSVVAWRQTYTASMDAWASEDEETQAKIKAAYAKLYGEGGTADNPTSDSAQGKLNSAKAANVEAAQKEAQMRTELASAKAYQESCASTAAAQQEAYEKALANYNAIKKKTTAQKRQIDAAWTALQASIARRDESQAAVDAADKRVTEAEANYAAAQKELADAEQKVSDAAAEVETAMNGIHELYSSCIEQTAQKVSVSVSKTDMDGAISDAAVTIKADAVSSAVKQVDAKGYATQSYVNQTASSITSRVSAIEGDYATQSYVTQTLKGWTWKIEDSDAAAYMSFTKEAGTGTLTLGGSASAVKLGGSKSTLDMSGAATVNIGTSGRCSVNIGTGSTDDVYSTINMGGKFSTVNIGCMTISQLQDSDYSSIKGSGKGSGISFLSSYVHIAPSSGSNVGVLVTTSGISVGNTSGVSSGSVQCGNISSAGIQSTGNITCTNMTADRQVNSQGAYMNVNIGPSDDGGSSCGSGSYRWSKVYAKNGTIDTSSREVKENIEPESEEKAARLLEVEVVKFDYKRDYWGSDDNKGWYGVIAEDVHGLFPEAVIDWDTGTETDDRTGESVKVYPGVAYSTFIPHLIKLCQMQQRQIDALETRVAALEGGAE